MVNGFLDITDVQIIEDNIAEMVAQKIVPSFDNVIKYLNKYFNGFVSDTNKPKIKEYINNRRTSSWKN